MTQVILVDREDRPLGKMEKLAAHQHGLLHRAFSLLILDQDRMLLQQRAASKYHCPGLWANACCSHPAPGESVAQAAARRLPEELGAPAPPLVEWFSFYYEARLDQGLIEHELDHVLVGFSAGPWRMEPAEVQDLRWLSRPQLQQEMDQEPHNFAPWFHIIMKEIDQRWPDKLHFPTANDIIK